LRYSFNYCSSFKLQKSLKVFTVLSRFEFFLIEPTIWKRVKVLLLPFTWSQYIVKNVEIYFKNYKGMRSTRKLVILFCCFSCTIDVSRFSNVYWVIVWIDWFFNGLLYNKVKKWKNGFIF